MARTVPRQVRTDLQSVQQALLDYIASPGSWFSGPERIAIAEESRNALECALCRARLESISPELPAGRHDTVTDLPSALVEVIHRVRVDSGRLSRRVFEAARAAGVSEGEYVEAVGIVAMVAGLDYYRRALGEEPFALPAAKPGAPSYYRPARAKSGEAFVAMIAAEEATGPEAGLYGDGPIVPNITRALSLVPDHARVLRRLASTHYVDLADLRDPSVGRAIDRVQIELVAARVSAINECFY